MKNTPRTILITLVSFGAYFLIDEAYFRSIRKWFNGLFDQISISHLVTYILLGLPIFFGTILLHNYKEFFPSLGLDKSLMKAAGFALVCTLPMFIGYGIVFESNSEFSFNFLFISVIAAAFFEELYFRGFLFGQIFRFTKWGFIPSVLIGAVLFGLVHLYQGAGLSQTAGIFLITFMGGILYSWVYVEWNYNLWVPIFLHLFMNLSWGLFSAGDNALGGVYSNVFRAITIALIIILTLRIKRRKGVKPKVNTETLWMKKP